MGHGTGCRGGLSQLPWALKARVTQSDSILKALALRQVSKEKSCVGGACFQKSLLVAGFRADQRGARQRQDKVRVGTGVRVNQGGGGRAGEGGDGQKGHTHPAGKGLLRGGTQRRGDPRAKWDGGGLCH